MIQLEKKTHLFFFHVYDEEHITFKIKFWKKWQKINKDDTSIIKKVILLYNYN